MDKQNILSKIQTLSNEAINLQNKKTELETGILHIDIELNNIMAQYDKLCRQLLK